MLGCSLAFGLLALTLGAVSARTWPQAPTRQGPSPEPARAVDGPLPLGVAVNSQGRTG